MNLEAAALLIGSIVVLAVLRITFVPPSHFIEGDDAALATGVARICEKDEIGPYFMHPPPVQVAEGSAATGAENVHDVFASMPARHRYYRYSSMPGMYLLGKLTCSLGEAATRLSWISFVSGTVYPLLLALFLIRLFGPFPSIALPIFYVFIAISPELWVSGSAYINDKIVAICFLVGALLLSLYSARDDEKQRLAVIALSGSLFGLAILMRLDTVLFLPAALLVVIGTAAHARGAQPWMETAGLGRRPAQALGAVFRTGETLNRYHRRVSKEVVSRVSPGTRGRLGGGSELRTLYPVTLSAVFLSATVFVYAAGMRLGDASLSSAISSAVRSTGLHVSPGKAIVLLSAVGWTQLLIVLVFTAVVAGLGILHLTQWGTSSLRHTSRWRSSSDRPLTYRLLLLGLLLFPEFLYTLFFPFFSQKYVLVASTIIAGLGCLISFGLWQRMQSDLTPRTARRWSFLLVLGALLLVVLGGILKLGVVRSGADGDRAIGGHLVFRLHPQPASTTARELVAYLDQNDEALEGSVVILHSSWLLEQAIAYESVIRGWSSDVVSLPISRAMEEEDRLRLRALGFMPSGDRVYLTLNRYVPRHAPNVSIMVPSNTELIAHKDLFSAEALQKAIPSQVYFLEQTCPSESSQEYVYPNRFDLRLCSQ